MENIFTCLTTKNNHCSEKRGWYISLQKIQARVMLPKSFLPAYSRMLRLNKKEYVMARAPTWGSAVPLPVEKCRPPPGNSPAKPGRMVGPTLTKI